MPPRIRYPCRTCGCEKVARDDPCPTCDGQPQHDVVGRGHLPGPPQYKCRECGWEPTHVRPVPGRSERFCGHCGCQMLLWQDRSPVSQCKQCEKIIEFPEDYCSERWQAWRNIEVWEPPEGRRRKRVVKSSWERPEESSRERSEGSSWESPGWDSWGGSLRDETATGQRETETVSQAAQWQAMPPPTSLDSGAPSKRARSQSDRPRFWQPKASGPSSSSGSQSAEAAPLPVVLETIPEAAPVAESAAASEQPGNLIRVVFGGSQQAETVDAAMADSSGNQSVEAAEAVAATSPQEGGLSKYKWRGQTYVEKVKSAKGVNTSHPLEEIYDYVAAFPQHICAQKRDCLLYTSPSPRDQRGSRMPSSA